MSTKDTWLGGADRLALQGDAKSYFDGVIRLTTPLMEKIKGRIASIGNQLTEPDEDWPMECYLARAGRRPGIIPVFGFEPEGCDRLIGLLTEVIRSYYAEECAIATPVWVAPVNGYSLVPASENPDRIECVMILDMTYDSSQAIMAYVNRYSDRPPTLGVWMPSNDAPSWLFRLQPALQPHTTLS